ncbi:DUF4097 family beta strand repeat-containing protein [Macrococcus equi]|uniref:DUF4097 family beta strand repeat-containing protein n=1 Tax=Macrococcus equi TaxID=3395462 RepID=UPI0039BE4DA3
MKKLFFAGLLFLFIGCIGMLVTGHSLFKEPVVNQSDTLPTNYKNIQVNVQSGEVHFKKSSDNATHIKIKNVKDKNFFQYNIKNNTLNIVNNKTIKNRRIFNYGFEQHNEPSIEITIPDKTYNNVKLITNKSAIEFDELKAKFLKSNAKIGAIFIDKLTSEKVDFTAGTGEIEVGQSDIKNINFDIKLGTITLDELNTDININGNVSSGQAELLFKETPKNMKFDITTSTGDIEMNDIAGSKSTLGNGQYLVKINVGLGQVEVDEA